jgi:dihydrofolate reductase
MKRISFASVRRLIVTNIVSLDGYYIEGPDWPIEIMDAAFDAYNLERLREAGTLLTGRTTFEGFRDFWPSVAEDPDERWTPVHREISRINNTIDRVVVSDTLSPDQTEPWRETRIVGRAEASEKLAELKQDGDGDILVFGSRTMWHQLFRDGLIDELHLMVGPIVRSQGTPVFDAPSEGPFRLVGTRTWPDSGNVLIQYAVAGEASQSS